MTLILAIALAQDPGMGEMLDRLSDPDLRTREEATQAVIRRWRVWTSSDLEMIEKRKTDPDPEVATRAAGVLREISFRKLVPDAVWKEEPKIAEIMLHGTGDEAADLVDRLAVRFPPRAIAPILIELLDDDRPTRRVSWPSDQPFKVGVGPVEPVEKALLREYVLQTLHSMVGKPQFALRESWHSWWKENQDKPERDWYLPDLDYHDDDVRVAAISRLAALKDATLVPALLHCLETLTEDKSVATAICALAPIPADLLVPHLKPYLGDRRAYVRLAAAMRLVTSLPRESIDAVVDSLENFRKMEPGHMDAQSLREGLGIVDWLASTRDERAYAFLFRDLKSGPVDRRMNILEAIHREEFPGIEGAILGAFDDSSACPEWGDCRVADRAGQFLATRLKMREKFVWTGSIEERDRNLKKIRERYKELKRP